MKSKKLYTIIATLIFGVSIAHADSLDSDSARVSLEIAKFAQVTNLEDFSLSLEGSTDGAANAFYSGSVTYNLESNTGVSVVLTPANLSNGSDSVSTNYDIDIGGNGVDSVNLIASNLLTFDTTAGQVNNSSHVIGARAQLGAISDQKAGAYSADITMTVSPL